MSKNTTLPQKTVHKPIIGSHSNIGNMKFLHNQILIITPFQHKFVVLLIFKLIYLQY